MKIIGSDAQAFLDDVKSALDTGYSLVTLSRRCWTWTAILVKNGVDRTLRTTKKIPIDTRKTPIKRTLLRAKIT